MSDQLIVEREGLSSKDKGELQAIVSALGGTSSARMRKADLIDQIMELSSGSNDGDAEAHGANDDSESSDSESGGSESSGSESSDSESSDSEDGDVAAKDADSASTDTEANQADDDVDEGHPVGADGEPLADWEIKILAEGGKLDSGRGQRKGKQNQGKSKGDNNDQKRGNGRANSSDDDDANNRRSRRRGRGRGRDRDDAGNDPVSAEPIEVEGYLDPVSYTHLTLPTTPYV